MVVQVFDSEEKRRIAEAVLRQLPDWFGLPESTKRYIEESAGMPFWAWRGGGENLPDTGAAQEGIKTSGEETQGSGNGKASGFLSLKETSPHTAEIFVMGVLPGEHRRGIGLPCNGISGAGVPAGAVGCSKSVPDLCKIYR